MSSNQCIEWQGNLACLNPNGLVIKSRHTIADKHVFGPDSDNTTLAISGLNLLVEESEIGSVKIEGDIDSLALQACGYSIDEEAEWTISCDDNNASIPPSMPKLPFMTNLIVK